MNEPWYSRAVHSKRGWQREVSSDLVAASSSQLRATSAGIGILTELAASAIIIFVVAATTVLPMILAVVLRADIWLTSLVGLVGLVLGVGAGVYVFGKLASIRHRPAPRPGATRRETLDAQRWLDRQRLLTPTVETAPHKGSIR